MASGDTTVSIWNRALNRIGETVAVDAITDDTAAAVACAAHYNSLVGELLAARPWSWATTQVALEQIDTQSVDHSGNDVLVTFAITGDFVSNDQVVVTKTTAGVATVQTYTTHYTISGQNVVFGTAPATGTTVTIDVTTSRVGWEHVYALPTDMVTPLALLYQGTRYSLLPVQARAEFAIMVGDDQDTQILCTDLDEDDFEVLEYVPLNTTASVMPHHFVNALVWRLAMELALSIKKDVGMYERFEPRFMQALDVASAFDMNLSVDVTEVETPSISARG